MTYNCNRSLSTNRYPSLQNGPVKAPSQNHDTPHHGPRRTLQEPEEPTDPLPSRIQICGHGHAQGCPPVIPRLEYVDSDPLQDDKILMQGPRIAERADDDPNVIRKVPSDQALPKFRWGSKQRTSGRSKSGLQILVPGRKIPVELIAGGPVTGKSIVYAYASSASSSGRSTNSFGAVGDHLTSARSALLSSSAMPVIYENQSTKPEKSLQNARASNRLSPLANLVMESDPDQDPYELLVVGETGPCRRQVTPQIIAPSSLKPRRRRSLSDLIEPRTTLSDQTGQSIPGSIMPRGTAALERPRGGGPGCSKDENIASPSDIVRDTYEDAPPVCHRAGPPFGLRAHKLNDDSTHLNSQHRHLDPATFTLPHGVSNESVNTGDCLC